MISKWTILIYNGNIAVFIIYYLSMHIIFKLYALVIFNQKQQPFPLSVTLIQQSNLFLMNKIKSQPTLFLVREAVSRRYIRHNKEEKMITVSWWLEVWFNPEQSFVKVCWRAWWEHQHTSLQHNICWRFHQVYENKLLCGTVSEIEIIMLGSLCLTKERVEYRWND